VFVGHNFAAPNVHAKEALLLSVCLDFYIHSYLSLQTATPACCGYQKAAFIEKSSSHDPCDLGSSADSTATGPWQLACVVPRVEWHLPTFAMGPSTSLWAGGKVEGDTLGASLGTLVAFFRGDGQRCSLVAPV